MIDIDKLLVDHDGDTVCGENLEYDSLLLEIREAIEGKPEQQMGDDVIEGIEPDWKKVKKNSLKLCSKTHSLEIIISLTQALINLEGYAGFADGAKLLEGVIEKYWDCIHPQIDPDDNDPIERLNMLAIFEDFNFLLSLQKIELVSTKGVGSVSLYNIRNSRSNNDDEAGDNSKIIDAVFKSCSNDEKEAVYSFLEQCDSSFSNISKLLSNQESVGASNAPTFIELLKIINESKTAIGAHLNHLDATVSDEDVDSNSNDVQVSQEPTNTSIAVGINNREDVISAIGKIENYYFKNEPGSPVPLLLKRAKSLVDKDFLALMEELSPDSLSPLEMIFGKSGSINIEDDYNSDE